METDSGSPGGRREAPGEATDLQMTGSKWKVSGKARWCEPRVLETQQAVAQLN